MASRQLLALGLVAALLSGCLVDADAPSLDGIPEGSPAAGPNAGSASSHGEPRRDDGPVQVEREGLLGATGRYVARQTITITNDFGGASQAKVSLQTGAGGVTARAWSEGGYKLVAVLEARADTADEARHWLARLTLEHDDDLSGGELELDSRVRFPTERHDGVSLSGLLTQSLPNEPSYRLRLAAGSGGATTAGLAGPSVDADTGSGGISIDGAFGRMSADAGSGGIELLGTANSVTARAGSGSIVADLATGGGGAWTFSAGSGGISVDLRRTAGDAFDVSASAGSGGVEVDLSDGRPVGAQSDNQAHVRSAGYDGADVRVQLRATAGSGGIDVRD